MMRVWPRYCFLTKLLHAHAMSSASNPCLKVCSSMIESSNYGFLNFVQRNYSMNRCGVEDGLAFGESKKSSAPQVVVSFAVCGVLCCCGFPHHLGVFDLNSAGLRECRARMLSAICGSYLMEETLFILHPSWMCLAWLCRRIGRLDGFRPVPCINVTRSAQCSFPAVRFGFILLGKVYLGNAQGTFLSVRQLGRAYPLAFRFLRL